MKICIAISFLCFFLGTVSLATSAGLDSLGVEDENAEITLAEIEEALTDERLGELRKAAEDGLAEEEYITGENYGKMGNGKIRADDPKT